MITTIFIVIIMKAMSRWTLSRFLEKVKEIHGNKFDYSAITPEHIKGCMSEISVTCNTCHHKWSVILRNHIRAKAGCPSWPKTRWTLKTFLQRSRGIHGNKYNYNLITEDKIANQQSKVPIICNACGHHWSPSISSHIYSKSGCPSCAGVVKWNLRKFLIRAKEIHGDKYDYSQITIEHIRGATSKVLIFCKRCNYQWSSSVNNHINAKSGCPSCAGLLKWDLKKFLEEARKIHGESYDYSQVRDEDIVRNFTKIPVACRKCGYHWLPQLNHHIEGHGCPQCAGLIKWDLEKFIKTAKSVHGDSYDYSQVSEEDIERRTSKVPIICMTCHHQWLVSIGNHISRKSGCPACKASRGERECQRILEECGLEYEKEVILPELPNKRYDFAFAYEDHLHLVEIDGIQHFEEIPYFHREERTFKERQGVDLSKTRVALERGASLIRIDYTQIDSIDDHIYQAIKIGTNLYLSTPEMYKYITDCL